MSIGEGITILILLSLSGFIGAAAAQAKKASLRQGFAWGFVLGPIGWVIAAVALQPEKPKTIGDRWHTEDAASFRDRAAEAKLEQARRLGKLKGKP